MEKTTFYYYLINKSKTFGRNLYVSSLYFFLFLFFSMTFLQAQCPVGQSGASGDCDGDGVPNLIDQDDDNDGITDCVEKELSGVGITDLFTLQDDALQISSNELQLTPDLNTRRGRAWSKNKIDFNQSFFFSFVVNLGNKDVGGADGIAIVFHNDPLGENASGLVGGGLGVNGIQNGIVLEIDTYDNFNIPEYQDIPDDHGMIWDTDNQSGAGILTPAVSLGNIEDGNWYPVSISWDAVLQTISYTVNGVNAGTFTSDLITNYFAGANLVYFGFSASTGNDRNDQRMRFNDLCEIPFLVDTDNDGIENYLDLDSDNDGISDVIEAGGTDTDNDGRADDNNNNVNNTGSNGIPTSAGSGLAPIDTGNDGSYDFLNLDSDEDGCSDANEAYNDSNADGGDGGQFGTLDPATVNSNGLVIEAGVNYALGSNNNVVTVTPAPTTSSVLQNFCPADNPRVSDLAVTGSNIIWYTAATGGNVIPSGTALVNQTKYYASQTTLGCESITRLEITVVVVAPLAPTSPPIQNFCATGNPTVSAISAIGSNIIWYTATSGGAIVAGSTALVEGTTYYASQTVNGCESETRLGVTVSFYDLTYDNDGDLIPDACDQDDDNDGILDSDELNCNIAVPLDLGQVSYTESGVVLSANTSTDYIGKPSPSGNGYLNGYDEIAGVSSIDFAFLSSIPVVVSDSREITITYEYYNHVVSNTQRGRYTWTDTNGSNHQKDYSLFTDIGNLTTSYTLTDAQIDDLYAGNWILLPITFTLPPSVSPGQVINITGSSFFLETILGGFAPVYDPNDSEVFAVSVYELNSCNFVDSDNDGIPNVNDLDSDNDGIYDIVETGNTTLDTNNDGVADGAVGTDGIPDSVQGNVDGNAVTTTVINSDTDGIPDHLDLDSDGDGCFDVIEAGFTDTDNPQDGVLGVSPVTRDANGVVTGQGGYTGTNVNVTTTSNVAVSITMQPSNDTICLGENTSFSVTASDTNTYQWQTFNTGTSNWDDLSNGTIYGGIETATLSLTNPPASFGGNQYRVTVGNSSDVCATDTSSVVTLTITIISTPTTSSVSQVFCASDNPTVGDISVTGSGVIWYDLATGGTAVANGTTLIDGTTYHASQTVDGCESTDRLSITVSFYDLTFDNDGDLIPDACDLDDDNDGILDVDECPIGITPMIAPTYDPGTPPGINATPNGWNRIIETPDVSDRARWGGVVSEYPNNQWTDGPVNNPPNGDDRWLTGYRNEMVGSTISDLVIGYTYTVSISHGNFQCFSCFSGGRYLLSPQLNVFIDRVEIDALTPNLADGNWSTATISFTATATSHELAFQNDTPYQSNSASIGTPSYVWNVSFQTSSIEISCDTDNDGIPNYFDLDSDNDGIYDVIEAGGIDTNNDGRADDTNNNTNNTGSNGIPISAGNGLTAIDTGNDGTYDFLNLDSDVDGCFDVIEAGYTDTDDPQDGVLGVSPVSVDPNGLVTGQGGYTGTSANVTSAGTAPSITTQPLSDTICLGADISFSVITINADTYQWQVFNTGTTSWDDLSNGALYSGTDTTILTVTNPTILLNSTQYRVIVENSSYVCATDTSDTVTLTISSVSVPSISVVAATCVAAASNTISNYDSNLNYSSTPVGLSVGTAGLITGGTNNTNYTVTAENSDTCTATSVTFTYDGDVQLASPVAPAISVLAASCSAAASNTVTNYDGSLTYSSTPGTLIVGAGGVITGGTDGTSYTIAVEGVTCTTVSSSFTYVVGGQLSSPTIPTISVVAASCSAAASNTVTNYNGSLTYSSTPGTLTVGAGGVITGGTDGTSYTITIEDGACTATSVTFTYDGDVQLSSPTVPTVSVVAASCSAAASNTVTNYNGSLTYSSTPGTLIVGVGGVITGGTDGTSYTITIEDGACTATSTSFTYSDGAQLSSPTAPSISVVAASCSAAASNTVTNYNGSLTYSSTPGTLTIGAGGVITGGTDGTNYTITIEDGACTATSTSFTYSDGAQLSSPTAPSISVVAASCSAAASNTVTNYNGSLTYSSLPGTLIVGAGGVITGGTDGTSYTITIEDGACTAISTSFIYDNDAQIDSPLAPTTDSSSQVFNAVDNPTIDDISVNGSGIIIWYDSDTNGNVVPSGTALVDGATYYATQMVNGCESTTFLEVTVTIIDEIDLSISKTVDNSTPNVGDIITYTITVTNSSLFDATSLVVNEPLVSGITYDSHTESMGTYDLVTGNWTIGTLQANQTATLSISVSVDVAANGTEITNAITHTVDQEDPDDTNEDTIEIITVINEVDLFISKTVDNATPNVGDVITYTITVSNTSLADATSLIVNEPLASGLTYDGHIASIGTYDSVSGDWIIGTLLGDEMATLSISVTVDEGTNGTEIANIITYTVDQEDPDDTNEDTEEVIIINNDIIIYNGLSPNNDGKNDYLLITGIESIENVIHIYNRWGAMVYETTNYGRNNNFFDGMSYGDRTVAQNDLLPEGAYYYVFEYTNDEGSKIILTGYIQLVR